MNFKRMFFYYIILVVFLPLTIQAAEKKWVYTVVEGDSLWSISQEYLE
ncbi:LysM peptidoglycan-binding domain-containing protein [Colwellia sp. BRX8-9]|nr:LysM peptidoglycan-binding domain-containing protein [Colwellia sp. BRX8-9]